MTTWHALIFCGTLFITLGLVAGVVALAVAGVGDVRRWWRGRRGEA